MATQTTVFIGGAAEVTIHPIIKMPGRAAVCISLDGDGCLNIHGNLDDLRDLGKRIAKLAKEVKRAEGNRSPAVAAEDCP